MSRPSNFSRLICMAAVLLAAGGQAHANDDFFSKANMKMIVGTGPGGSYDAIGRLVAKHIGKHLPGNPSIVSSNLPGASGLTAANNFYNLSAQDGSVIGVIPPEILFNQMFGDRNARFDARKFNWLGNPFGSAIVVVVLDTAPVKNWREATQKPSIMGATGSVGPDAVIANLANGTLGTKFKVVTGYKSGNEVGLAMERGEVHGRGAQSWSGWKATNPEWIEKKRLIPLFQVALKAIPELPDVPLLMDLVEGETKALVSAYTSVVSLNRPFLTTPNVPSERVALLRKAFDATMADADFVKEANQMKIELGPISGVDLQKMVDNALSLDPKLVKQLQSLVNP